MINVEEVKRRYSQTELATDKFGRAIIIGRLKPSQQAKIADIAGDKTGDLFRIVACVRKIDSDNIPFPRTRAELESVMDRLDNEGLEAVTEAMMRMANSADSKPSDPVDAAKNS